jgi:hypothetical protein
LGVGRHVLQLLQACKLEVHQASLRTNAGAAQEATL